jgi:hypothetical protein
MIAPRTALAAAALGAALVLTGCSGDPEPEPTPEPSAGPLETLFRDYLAEWSNEDVTRQLTRMEEAIAACMAEQGFSYTPVDYSAVEVDFLGSDLGVAPGSLEFAQRYGYGLTTDPWGAGDIAEEVSDPNAEYVAAMSEAEQEAYFSALYGERYAERSTIGRAPDDEAITDYSWEDAGCTGLAQQQLLTGHETNDEEFLGLQQAMAEMMESAMADPRLDRANADWAACMAESGYPGLSTVGDAEAAIGAEVDAVRAAAALDAGRPGPPDLTDPSETEAAVAEQLEQISPREIATAVADLTCQSEVGYDALRSEVDAEYQREFLAENLEEIQEWLRSLQSLRTED